MAVYRKKEYRWKTRTITKTNRTHRNLQGYRSVYNKGLYGKLDPILRNNYHEILESIHRQLYIGHQNNEEMQEVYYMNEKERNRKSNRKALSGAAARTGILRKGKQITI